MRYKILAAAVIILIVAALVLLYLYDPMQVSFYPRCPSKTLCGYDCPGCGSLRAIHALTHGDLVAAWNFNPALFFAIPLAIIFFIGDNPRSPRIISRLTHHPLTPILLLLAIITWTIFRNL